MAWIAGAAVLAALAGGLMLWRRPPPPPVVRPAAPELLDPAVRRLVERLAAKAETEPRDALRRGRLGLAYEANLLWEEARASFEQAIELDREPWLWRYHRALVLREGGDARGALEQLRQVVAERPAFAPGHERLGHALLELGDLDGAQAAFERVVELEPDQPHGPLGVGEVWLQKGEPQRALEILEPAAARHPGERGIRYRLGRAYQALGRSAEAERELARGLEPEPSYLPDALSEEVARLTVHLAGLTRRAGELYAAGRTAETARILEGCLADHPDNQTVHNTLALAYLAEGRPQLARELLDRSLAVDPGYFETYLVLASWATHEDRRDEAVAFAEQAVERNDAMAATHTAYAQALVAVGRHAEAATSLERALDLERRDPRIYLGLGVLYEGLGRAKEALALYRQAVERWPELAPAQLGLARSALAAGEMPIARAALEAARRLQPDHPELAALTARLAATSR